MLFIRLITRIYLRMPFKCLEERASKYWRHWAEKCNNLIKVCQTFWNCSFKSEMMRSRVWAPLYMMSTPSYSVTRRPHKVPSVTVSNQIVSLILTALRFSALSQQKARILPDAYKRHIADVNRYGISYWYRTLCRFDVCLMFNGPCTIVITEE